jgi:quinol monooxygenase YgiN
MSAAGEVTVVARWLPSEGEVAEVLRLVGELRAKSMLEPGCAGYEVYQTVELPRGVLLYERYRDAEALDAHRQSAHYQELLVGRILPLLAERKVEVFGA